MCVMGEKINIYSAISMQKMSDGIMCINTPIYGDTKDRKATQPA